MVASGLQESEYETSFFLVYLLIKNNSSGGNHAGRTFKKHQGNGDIPVLNYRQAVRFTTFIFVTWFFLVRLVTFSLTEVDKVKIYFCWKRIDTLATEKFHPPFQECLRACKVHKIILLGGSRINFVPISPALIGNIYRSGRRLRKDLPLRAPYQDKTCICCTQIFENFSMKACKHRSKPSGDARAFRTTNRVSKRTFRALALRAGLAALVATIRSLS